MIASGIFYLRRNAPNAFFQRFLRKAYDLARSGVALNSLSAWGWSDDPDTDETAFDPASALTEASRITTNLVLRHDYHPSDFTVYLRK